MELDTRGITNKKHLISRQSMKIENTETSRNSEADGIRLELHLDEIDLRI